MRRITAVTTSRADFGHLYWPLKHLDAHPDVDLDVLVTGAHLSPEFGHTVDAVRAAGFRIRAEVECLLSSDSDTAMAKTIGIALMGLADALDQDRPDLLLLIADRYEMLAPAAAALAMRIPVAHIEGGDISEGAIDDAVRNALTKMSHLHFTTSEAARRRVIAMGEEAWRVIRTGAPSLDHLHRSEIPSREQLEETLGYALGDGAVVVSYHPVTLLEDTVAEADALYRALEAVEGQLIFCFPNADAGSRALIRRARELADRRPDTHVHVHLEHLDHWALFHQAGCLVGNSSSGLMETPSVGLPCVDVGIRQRGRLQAANIIHAPADATAIRDAIRRALEPGFREGLQGMENPYGDGHAGERIADTLATVPLDETLLIKRALPVAEADREGPFRFIQG